jgi:hypothetical protein
MRSGARVGPWDRFCSALGHPGASGGGSVAVITLTSGVVRTKLRGRVLNEILAFDWPSSSGTCARSTRSW